MVRRRRQHVATARQADYLEALRVWTDSAAAVDGPGPAIAATARAAATRLRADPNLRPAPAAALSSRRRADPSGQRMAASRRCACGRARARAAAGRPDSRAVSRGSLTAHLERCALACSRLAPRPLTRVARHRPRGNCWAAAVASTSAHIFSAPTARGSGGRCARRRPAATSTQSPPCGA